MSNKIERDDGHFKLTEEEEKKLNDEEDEAEAVEVEENHSENPHKTTVRFEKNGE